MNTAQAPSMDKLQAAACNAEGQAGGNNDTTKPPAMQARGMAATMASKPKNKRRSHAPRPEEETAAECPSTQAITIQALLQGKASTCCQSIALMAVSSSGPEAQRDRNSKAWSRVASNVAASTALTHHSTRIPAPLMPDF